MFSNKFMNILLHSQVRVITRKRLSETKEIISVLRSSAAMLSSSGSTVDNKEVEHHSKLTDEWWDERGTMKALHAMNAIRVPFIKNGLENSGAVTDSVSSTKEPLKGLKILDVGCGGGFLTEPLCKLGAEVTGIEPSPQLVEVAKTHASQNPRTKNIRYFSSSIEEHIKDPSNVYDAVVASEVVEHVSNPELFIKSCVQALKPGGSIFITTPNKTYMAWLFGIVVAENVLRIVPRGTHSYDKFIPYYQLQQILEQNNCTTMQISGSFYNVLTNSWSWIPYKGFCYALHAVKSSF